MAKMATPRQAFLILSGFGLAILLSYVGVAGYDLWRGETHRSRGRLKGYDRILRATQPEAYWAEIRATVAVGVGSGVALAGFGAFVLWLNRWPRKSAEQGLESDSGSDEGEGKGASPLT